MDESSVDLSSCKLVFRIVKFFKITKIFTTNDNKYNNRTF